MVKKLIAILLGILFILACQAAVPSAGNDEAELVTNTSQPTPTAPVPTKTKDPNAPVSIDALNTVLPDDIIQEIAYYGGAGGGTPGCRSNSYSSPIILFPSEEPYELMQIVSISVCGVPLQEDVNLEIQTPDGQIHQNVLEPVESNYPNEAYVTFDYLPMPQDQTGIYTFTFSGKGWKLEYLVEVIEPAGGRLYLYESKLYFLGFQSNEPVRLMVYQSNPETSKSLEYHFDLVGWSEYQMNDTGKHEIKTDISEDVSYVAVGNQTGSVHYQEPGSDVLDWGSVSCSGAPNPVGIRPFKFAEVLVDDVPSFKFDQSVDRWVKDSVLHLGKGTIVEITTNAYCMENTYAWQIGCINGQFCLSMIPEADAQNQYLRPLDQLPPTSTPDPSNIPACPGTKPTRLQVGMNAEVTTSGAAPQLSIRAQPSMTAQKVHVIAAGRDMVILQGPICADDSYWWYIRSEQGFEGWTREADNVDYWIDPLP